MTTVRSGGPSPVDAAEVVLTYLREQADEIRRHDPSVREDAPDAVHRMRVAVRRASSSLATFGDVLETGPAEALRRELRWFAEVLGEARDAEVALQRWGASVADSTLGEVHRAAHARVVEAMASSRYRQLVDDLDTLIARPPWTSLAHESADGVLPPRVRGADDRMVRRAGAVDDTDDETLHAVRKAAKRARYAAEVLVPLVGDQADAYVRAVREVQSVLGDHHDAVVAQPLLRRLAAGAHAAGKDTRVYEHLEALEKDRAREQAARFDEVWSVASDPALRRWLA